jgi:ATP-dependent DNA helicase RecG
MEDWALVLDKKPGQLVEFIPQVEPETLAETLIALANADGGTIYIGVEPGGRVLGVPSIEEVEEAFTLAQKRCRPPVKAEWERVETPYGTVLSLLVYRSIELHSLDDGRVYLRVGAENKLLSGEEIRRLASTKPISAYEEEPVPGATIADLSEEIIEEYLKKREERTGRRPQGSVEEILKEIGALTRQGEPTVAGVLLFGANPQFFLPQSGVVFVRFVGNEAKRPEGFVGYGRREEVGGPLCRVIERSWEIIWEEMKREAVVKGLVREDRTEYPPFAVREALVNAVAHRDYRLRGRKIEIKMYDDRLEVTSPGGLPGYITLDNIVEEHFSRNPRIVSGLYYWGFIEELGLGIDMMIEEMVNAGHPPPEFRATPYSFTVILYNVQERAPIPRWEMEMNERQLAAINYIRQHGRITNREYRRLCPHVSAETLRLDLADLVEKGILIKIGDKRGTYYILK